MGSIIYCFFLDSPKKKNQKKRTPGSMACSFTCAAWDKRPHSHNKETRLVEVWDEVASGF
ncbi:MAG: hypothetical protein B5M56_10540 [Desulfococcus sp. 4484_241]|nr:MAG: hypothetical protein B5M56_10540 [Desulfococcus sp. 4484_241]